jgi:hypothetical protein
MNDKRLWLVAWAAVSGLWILYWGGMSIALGVEALRDMIAELGWPLLIGGLCLSVPAGLYLVGAIVCGIAKACKSSP